MPSVQCPPSVTQGDVDVAVRRQPSPLLIQKRIGSQRQDPEPHQCGGAEHLILIQAEEVFAIGEEDFDGPPGSNMLDESWQVGFQIARGPLTRLSLQGFTEDDHLAAIERAHACGHHMDVDELVLAGLGGPGQALIIGG